MEKNVQKMCSSMYVTPSEAAAGAAETLARPSPTLARDLSPPGELMRGNWAAKENGFTNH